jgi:hypothetical protein
MRSYWLSLQTATIQHPITLGKSACFSLSLSAYTALLNSPQAPCPPITVNLTLKMKIKHRKISYTHTGSTSKTVEKSHKCLFINQI